MTVAFVVLAHGSPRTLRRLLERLSPFPAYVHLDASVNIDRYSAEGRLGDVAHAVMSETRRCLHWGGYSIVRAMLETLELALRRSPDAGHFAFLSGQCYPLRPVDDFASYLASTPTPVLCRGYNLSEHALTLTMGMDRVRHRHWLDGAVGHIRKISPHAVGALLRRSMRLATWPLLVRQPPITHAAGSQWVSVPRALAEELVAHYVLGGFDYLSNALAPDEIAIPSYVYSTSWREKTPNGALEPATSPTIAGYANFHWLRTGMRGYVDSDDLAGARASDAYFVRKVSIEHGPAILNALDDL